MSFILRVVHITHTDFSFAFITIGVESRDLSTPVSIAMPFHQKATLGLPAGMLRTKIGFVTEVTQRRLAEWLKSDKRTTKLKNMASRLSPSQSNSLFRVFKRASISNFVYFH